MTRVMSVPAGHPYVRSLAGPGVSFLPDPPVPGAPPEQWWPPVALTPDWIRANAGGFDLLHVHFGTEGRTTAQLAAMVDALREVGRPLVYTAHDLQHPHLTDQDAHAEHLALLAGAADQLITLTDGAARELHARFGVRARVIPHPQLAPDAWFARADAIRAARPTGVAAGRSDDLGTAAGAGEPDGFTAETATAPGPQVGVHLRAMRANVRPGAWLAELARALADLLPPAATTSAVPGTLHLFINDPLGGGAEAADALAATLAAVDGLPTVAIHRRARPDDDALATELAGLDVAVLPYGHGTHSGFLELCWDLGVPVLSPAVGHFADQHDDPWSYAEFDPARPGDAATALVDLLHRPAPPPAAARLEARPAPPPAAARLEARHALAAQVRQAHREVYAEAVAAPIR